MRVKCLAQEHDTMSLARARTRTARSGDERTNHEATATPTSRSRLMFKIFMGSEMVQHSQSLYSFTFNALFIVHEYIYSHSTTKFLCKTYIYSHLTTYFLFTKIFTHIYGSIHSHSTVYIRSHSRSKYWFNTVQYSFNIFCAPPLRITRSQLWLFSERKRADEGRPSKMEVIHWQDLFSAALDLLEECEREWYTAEVGVRENIQIRLEYLIVALRQVLPFVSVNSAQY